MSTSTASVVARPRLRGGQLASLGIFELVLLGYAAIVVYPLLVMLASSLKSTGEIFQDPLALVPPSLRLSNYAQAWDQAHFGTYFQNSLLVGVVSVIFILLFGSMAAYVLARYPFPGNQLVYLLFLLGFMVPIRLAIVPLFILMRDLHLLDSLVGLVVVYVAGGMPFTIFILVNFFRRIPRDLEEAARIDGAGTFGIYWRIMLPLVRPALATVAIFEFLHVWNDFFFPLIFIGSPSLRTIPLGMSAFFGEYANNWGLLFAGLSISIVPVLVLFLLMSRQFIAGLTAGAIR